MLEQKMLGEKKALPRAFFFDSSIFYFSISILISTCFLWSVQSPLISSINNEVVAYISISLLLIFFLSRRLCFQYDAIFFLFLGGLIISTINGVNERYWGTKFIVYLIYAGNALLFYNIAVFNSGNSIKRDNLLKCILLVIIIASVVSNFIVIYQWLGYANNDLITNIWIYPASGARLSANLAQPNHLATLLVLGICATFYFSEKTDDILIALIFILISSFCIFLTYSRTSYISLLFVAIYYSYLMRFEKKYILLSFSPIIFLFLISQTFTLWKDISPLPYSAVGDRGLESGRYLLWSMAWDGIKDKFWFGYGPGNIIGMYKQILPTHLSFSEGSVPSSSHNLILDLALFFGVPFALIFSLVLIKILFNAFNRRGGEVFGYAYLAVIPIFTHSMLEYPENYAYFLLPLSLFLGIANPFKDSEKSNIKKSVFFYFAYIVISFVTVCSIFNFYTIENNFKKLRLQNLNVEIKNPFIGSDKCILKMYCDFLDAHLIDDISSLNDRKYNYLDDLSESLPTPKVMELAIFKAINDKQYGKIKNEIINYCLFFGADICRNLEGKIKKYDLHWGNYFPTQEIIYLESKWSNN